ncbi:hypothetical protein CURTO8I2_220010 [Curtobacterium sp. 8I-2]|nr:hypothetical protein CURTO8I2_220010 [Curtobacterium sp. 8I-2]
MLGVDQEPDRQQRVLADPECFTRTALRCALGRPVPPQGVEDVHGGDRGVLVPVPRGAGHHLGRHAPMLDALVRLSSERGEGTPATPVTRFRNTPATPAR